MGEFTFSTRLERPSPDIDKDMVYVFLVRDQDGVESMLSGRDNEKSIARMEARMRKSLSHR